MIEWPPPSLGIPTLWVLAWVFGFWVSTPVFSALCLLLVQKTLSSTMKLLQSAWHSTWVPSMDVIGLLFTLTT
jgi:hypothetical protein